MAQAIYKLLDGVAANTTGSSFRIPTTGKDAFVIVQYDLDGATGSILLEGRLDSSLAWATIEAAVVADGIVTYDALPNMRATLSGYTGPGNVSVFAMPPA